VILFSLSICLSSSYLSAVYHLSIHLSIYQLSIDLLADTASWSQGLTCTKHIFYDLSCTSSPTSWLFDELTFIVCLPFLRNNQLFPYYFSVSNSLIKIVKKMALMVEERKLHKWSVCEYACPCYLWVWFSFSNKRRQRD
jgi:hypothetical protein